MLTRKQVARRFCRSLSTVRRMEGTKLFPIVDDQGVHWFDEDEVEAVAAEIAESGRALPDGATEVALEHFRRKKKELVDDLEFAEMTISALKGQLVMLQERALANQQRRKETHRAPVVDALREDVDYLVRHIPNPSFQAELVISRIRSALRLL